MPPKASTARYSAPEVVNQMALPGLEVQVEEKVRPWPDCSKYGLHFGMVKMPSGEHRLVMVDVDGAWAEHAPLWGFQPSRWVGLWTKANLKFSIPNFNTLFPNATIREMTDTQIRDHVSSLIIKRQSMRISQVQQGANSNRMSWHPRKLVKGSQVSPEEAVPVPDIAADVAIQQIIYLGLNHLGQRVYERGDGGRFTKEKDKERVVASEDDVGPSPVFLRPLSDDMGASLHLCATGLVREITDGAVLRSPDFERYLRSIFGEDANDPKSVESFHQALDRALFDVALEGGEFGADAFETALRLHEGRPTFYRAHGTAPLPLPLASILHTVASSYVTDPGAIVFDINANDDRGQTWNWPSSVAASIADFGAHDVAIASLSTKAIQEVRIDGMRITRDEYRVILESLSKRSEVGVSAFVINGGFKAGHMDADFKRLLSHVGTHYQVLGASDIDSSMIASGNDVPARLLLVGERLERTNIAFSVPASLTVHYDYESLWKWSEIRTRNAEDLGVSFGEDDSRAVNRWQAPYIPASQVSEPEAMSPRNMLGPVRKALAKIVETTNMSIDDYVATKLQWSMEQLETYLSAEQVDAVALGIFSIDNGRGIVEADQTGMGKGRVCASLMRYGKLLGHEVMFLTAQTQLFREIYQDIEDIGSLHLFQNPFIVNSNVVLQNSRGAELGRSATPSVQAEQFLSGAMPKGQLVLATYSQFNRKPAELASLESTRAANEALKLIAKKKNRFETLATIEAHVGLGYGLQLMHSCVAHVRDDNKAAIQVLTNFLASPAVGTPAPILSSLNLQLKLRKAKDSELKEYIEELRIPDLQTLKQNWIRSPLISNTLVVADESHLAAGPNSQTNANLSQLVKHASATAYSSATFSQGTEHFGIYSPIFPESINPDRIKNVLQRGGAPLQEILSAMLATDGRLIRREHDLSNIDFQLSTDTARLERNERWANSLASVLGAMGILSGEIEESVKQQTQEAQDAAQKQAEQENRMLANPLKKVPKVKLKSGVEYTNFSSHFYNLSRSSQMAFAVDHTVERAINAIKAGRKPVITIDQTLEATLHALTDKNTFEYREPTGRVTDDDDQDAPDSTVNITAPSQDDLLGSGYMAGDRRNDEPLLSTQGSATYRVDEDMKPYLKLGRRVGFKDVLRAYAENLIYGWQWSIDESTGKKVKIRKRTNLALPGMDEAMEEIHRLIDEMEDIPLSPLDEVKRKIRAAGYSIGELSGRELSLQEDANGFHVIHKMAQRSRNDLRDAFNCGQLDALILSRAGSTGISLHASERFADQRQRELIEMQAAASITHRMQFWGRVNRKGQMSSPIIRLMSNGLPGEVRLLTMQISKLRAMSANISGNADNAAIDESLPDIINPVGNEVCFRWLESNPMMARRLAIPLGEFSVDGDSIDRSNTRFVDMLTGRISMLWVHEQRIVYEQIGNEFRALIEQYEMEGRNPLKAGEFDVKATRGDTTVFDVTPCGTDSIFNDPVYASEIKYTITREGIPFNKLDEECRAGRQELEDQFAGPNWIATLRDKIDAETLKQLPQMLSRRHPTIAAALADKAPNAVNNLHNKAKQIQAILSSIVPGSAFTITNTELNSTAGYVVVGLKVPTDDSNLCNPSSYQLKVRDDYDYSLKTMTLSSLLRAGNRVAHILEFGSRAYEERQKHVFSQYKHSSKNVITRVILEGNLFKAAQIADARGMGQAITYSDNAGTWHHAILMPEKVTLRNVADLPLDIVDPKVLYELLTSDRKPVITNSLNLDKQGWRLEKVRDDFVLSIASKENGASWVMADKKMEEFFIGGWTGSRITRSAVINPERLQEFCEQLLGNAAALKMPVLTSPGHRPWVLDYCARQKEAEKITMAEAFANQKDDLADLSNILANAM